MNYSKADILKKLRGTIKTAEILDQICFTRLDWQNNPNDIFQQINNKNWSNINLIIRSSAANEDTLSQSMAGHFLSLLNIKGKKNITIAINDVIAAFNDDRLDHQIFIQPMLENIKLAGVAFTYDNINNAPYYKINYDDKSGTSDSITKGDSNDNKIFYYHKGCHDKFNDFKDDIIALCRELEEKCAHHALDIEFAIDDNNQLYLFQTRPLILSDSEHSHDMHEHHQKLQLIGHKLQQWIQPQPYLYGDKAIYGIMPDWNPAEMIGIKPKTLALSLYRELITDSIWAYQRHNYGYSNLRSFPLMVEFAGMPYIDVRVSFNSFIPKTLDKKIAEKLVNYYLNRLRDNPHYHDKVEFKIIFSCYSFDIDERIAVLNNHGFSNQEIIEIKESLRLVTNNITHNIDGLWKKDLEKIDILQQKFDLIANSNLDDFAKIYWLIEDCKRYGTLPFAGLARAGFIAIELLKSLRDIHIISSQEYQEFLTSLNTVSSHILDDVSHLSKADFLKKYGHLRPNTYDITSPSYHDNLEAYFADNYQNTQHRHQECKEFKLSIAQLNAVNDFLEKHGFDIDAIGLLNFIKAAIEAREYAKFMFTRNIDYILKTYKKITENYGISNEDAAFTHIHVIMAQNSGGDNSKTAILNSIEQNKQHFQFTKSLNLPPLICQQQDIFYFHDIESSPNYITQNSVQGDIISIDIGDKKQDLNNKIILIESADPGYDWVFSHNIKGLITKYGGANSHMAIRSAELNIPAIIGAGMLYDNVKHKKSIFIDCMNKIVK